MNKLNIEIASSPSQWERGLMFRKSLEENSGMLFKFTKPQILKFWGLNTYIPLDIAFIDKDHKIVKISRIKPMSMNTVGSDCDCLMAVEANEGYFHKNGYKEGLTIKIDGDKLFFAEKK